MNKKLLERIQELFFERLEAKTGWGKNDVKEEYRKAMVQALIEAVDESDEQNTQRIMDEDLERYNRDR